MKIDLAFENVPADIESAIADIRIEDQSEADAPALQFFAKRFGPFAIKQSHPRITLDLDLAVPNGSHELSIVVRAKARTQMDQSIEFLNTTTTPFPRNSNESVQVVLSRIN
jgi:hypothetical protein